MPISVNFTFIFDVLREACPAACDPYLAAAQSFVHSHLFATACVNLAATIVVNKVRKDPRVRCLAAQAREFMAGSLLRDRPTTLFSDDRP